MASEPWKTRPGGNIVRWRNGNCESHPWGVPSWFKTHHHRRYRRRIQQALNTGDWDEATKDRPPLPYWW